MLNLNEHKCVLILNFKMPTIVDILKFMTRINNNFFRSEEKLPHLCVFDTHEDFKFHAYVTVL